MTLRILITTALLLQLSACGFHLRQAAQPACIQVTGSEPLATTLRAQISNRAACPTYTQVTLSHTTLEQRPSVVDEEGVAREYELLLRTTVKIGQQEPRDLEWSQHIAVVTSNPAASESRLAKGRDLLYERASHQIGELLAGI